jgi:dephospho-CoA kinase
MPCASFPQAEDASRDHDRQPISNRRSGFHSPPNAGGRHFSGSEAAVLRIGLTGGISAGKSTVGEMFVTLGAHLIKADEIAHELMLPGQPVYGDVVEHFGRSILDPGGQVNRARLAEAAFGTATAGGSRIQELNQIVHPAVVRKQEEWMREIGAAEPSAIAIVEAALLIEAGAHSSLDFIIVVTCVPEQRVLRWADRRHISREAAEREVNRRMAAQLPDEEKIKAADYVIDNSGSLEETRRQVKRIHDELASKILNPR